MWWSTYSQQEKRLNVFQLRSLCKMLGITWQDQATKADVLSCGGLPSMNSLLRQKTWSKGTLQVWRSTLTPGSSWLTIGPNGELLTVKEHIMASQARWHELTAEMCCMCSKCYAAQQEGTTVTNSYQCDVWQTMPFPNWAPQPPKMLLQQHYHLALFLFLFYFTLLYLSRLSTFYLCFYIL